MHRNAVAIALLSAALFGLSTPAAKTLLDTVDPALLAGLLYCGAGIGVALLRRVARPLLSGPGSAETPIGRRDRPWLAGAILAGGIVGPILLMLGLSRTSAAFASLLLTLEGVATTLLAWLVFKEGVDRRIALGMVCLVAGAIVLSWSGTPSFAGLIGPLAIVGACLAWALDNNLTRRVSLADPLQIVELKGLIAGPFNLLLGLWASAALPSFRSIIVAGLVGFVGYGISLVLFVSALRHLGTARTGAYFSTAPFVGAVAAVFLLREPLTVQLVAAGLLIGLGVWLHLTEDHDHEHEHDHASADPPGEPHSHWHRHNRLRHKHPHMPDMHHTHRH